jgi:uncharacterized protein YecT (DUF1311 family)
LKLQGQACRLQNQYGLHSPPGRVQTSAMKSYLNLAAIVALLVTLVSLPVRDAKAEDQSDRPGSREQAEADKANKNLEAVFRDLMSKADTKMKIRLRAAQLAWIKWKDAEANYIARRVAVGGSALRVAYAEAEEKLVKERIAVLKAYASE